MSELDFDFDVPLAPFSDALMDSPLWVLWVRDEKDKRIPSFCKWFSSPQEAIEFALWHDMKGSDCNLYLMQRPQRELVC